MKILRFLLPGLVILAAAGLLCYQGFITKDLDTKSIFRCAIIIAGALLTMFKSGKPRSALNKKALYQKAYPQFIGNVFSQDPKLEKQFYAAVDLFNQRKYEAGLRKLTELRKQCRTTDDIYAVTVFSALCCGDLQLHTQAISHYKAALALRPNTTLASNLGLCYHRLGQVNDAIDAYQQAIDLDRQNAKAYNNLSAVYFGDGDYESALELAETAISLDARFPQALSTAAICCALLGDDEQYQSYYRRAVSAGYDGKRIKQAIENLNPN